MAFPAAKRSSSCCSPEESTGASGVVSPQPPLGSQGGWHTGAFCLTWPSLSPVTKPSLSHWELAFQGNTHGILCSLPATWVMVSGLSWCCSHGITPPNTTSCPTLSLQSSPQSAPLSTDCFLRPFLQAVHARGLPQGACEWLGTGGGWPLCSLLMLGH